MSLPDSRTSHQVEWFVLWIDFELGPMSLADLAALARNANISPQTRVRRGRDGAWTAAGELPEIAFPNAPSLDDTFVDSGPSDTLPMTKEPEKKKYPASRYLSDLPPEVAAAVTYASTSETPRPTLGRVSGGDEIVDCGGPGDSKKIRTASAGSVSPSPVRRLIVLFANGWNRVKFVRSGKRLFRHPNGTPAKEIAYLDHKVSGVARVWHDTGILASETIYSAGKKNGYERKFDRTGKLISQVDFVYGEAMPTKPL